MKTPYITIVAVLAGAALGAMGSEALKAQVPPPAFVVGEIDVENALGGPLRHDQANRLRRPILGHCDTRSCDQGGCEKESLHIRHRATCCYQLNVGVPDT